MALSIMFWVNYTRDKLKLIRKSETAVNSDHVLKFVYDRECLHVSAVVQASMRDRSYKVEVHLNDAYGVTYSSCECPLGQFSCHHVAAALLFGYRRASKTDVKCSWLKTPKSKIRPEIASMEELYPPRKPNYKALTREVTDDDRKFIHDELHKLGRFTALRWILSPEPPGEAPVISSIEDLILSQPYLEAPCKRAWLSKALLLSPSKIAFIAKKTVGQRTNPVWCIIRKHRITASNFGAVLACIKRNRYPPSLMKRLLSAYNLEAVKSVAWGINHEAVALRAYEAGGGVIEHTGIWLHESGVLGASPDGLVKTPFMMPVTYQSSEARNFIPDIIEVKCPYAARTVGIEAGVDTVKGFCLVRGEDNCLHLPESHEYYHQIQGQLYILDKDCCDLLVWTPIDMVVIRIAKDPSWAPNMVILIDFFHNQFLKSILS